jgi:hypothetical protein
MRHAGSSALRLVCCALLMMGIAAPAATRHRFLCCDYQGNKVAIIASDGSINEVDLLVIGPTGLFLVEIKSWPGSVASTGWM